MEFIIKNEVKRTLNAFRKANQIDYRRYCCVYKQTVRYLISKNISDKIEIRSKVKNMLIYVLMKELNELNGKSDALIMYEPMTIDDE